MSAALFELISHLEVALRNAVDRTLSAHFADERVGIPWFLRRPPMTRGALDQIELIRDRLRGSGRDNRHQIIANLSFGFWSGMFGKDYDELWRECLHQAFPHADGKRKTVGPALEAVRKLRNRVAHHDSVLGVDVPFEQARIMELSGYISPHLRRWLERIERCTRTYEARPHSAIDSVVVPATHAWELYRDCAAYVCQPGRSFRAVKRMAFYVDQQIQPEFPLIVGRRDNVEWSETNARRLVASEDREDRKIAHIIRRSKELGWAGGRYQVFLLTAEGHPDHRSRAEPMPHSRRGRGTAFVRSQRYVSLHSLQTHPTTEDYYRV